MSSTILGALGRLAALLEAHGIEYAVIGGVAPAAWARPRATLDIDVLVAREPLDPERVAEILATNGLLRSTAAGFLGPRRGPQDRTRRLAAHLGSRAVRCVAVRAPGPLRDGPSPRDRDVDRPDMPGHDRGLGRPHLRVVELRQQ